ncbi:MAG: Glycosyl transferase family 2 [Candidatus Woesebacteria bacterium GW2011_GWB1_39_10]|uniref:Glycosyl transferase family 2 n=1 Tax=Candidatus Woesebacteria bacterium GW2011_GWB1_39_10 TaxID=1618572 RepID=A0A0G0LU38_9BACT|nr:MAG: Glycosyl transferase family 2 [Candidatus Woesebacteria bacterium GW2011_GWB1_39_10]
MKIVAHALVKNEERWIWYSLMSVLDYVDEIMVWDTGSTDATVSLIKSIKSPKIKFQEAPANDPVSLTRRRQEMLDRTQSDWVLILDGDEIWTDAALKSSIDNIVSHQDSPYLINSYITLLGDMFHFQDPNAGRYKIGPHSGNITIRFINLNKLPDPTYKRGHPDEGIFVKSKTLLQEFHPEQSLFIKEPYLHATFLKRTSLINSDVIRRSHKQKYELGMQLSRDFKYPKSFYFSHTPQVPSPWSKRNLTYLIQATWQSPLKLLKRSIFK